MLPMLAGAPTVVNVTLCVFAPVHDHVTVVCSGTVAVDGEKLLSAMSIDVMSCAVVVNVTCGVPGSPDAVAVAVCAPVPGPSVRCAVAVPAAPVVFCAGVIEPPPIATAQSIVTPCFGLLFASRAVTV